MKKIITILIMVVFTTGLTVSFGGYVSAGDPVPGLDISIQGIPGGKVSTGNYNSSLSNKSSVAKINEEVGNILMRYGIGGAVINKVTDALAGGVYEAELKSFLIEIGIGGEGVNEVFAKLDEFGAAFDEESAAVADVIKEPPQPPREVSVPDTGDTQRSATGCENDSQCSAGMVCFEGLCISAPPVQGGKDPLKGLNIKKADKYKKETSSGSNTGGSGDIPTPAVDSFFDVFTELEVFIEMIAKDASITKADARRVIDALMAVSPAFIIDENGLPESRKAELVEAIASGASLTKADAKRALDAFVGATTKSAPALHKALITGERVALVGSGSFSISKRKARTGATIQIPAKIEAALNAENRAAKDYEFARRDTIAAIKKAGINDPAKIEEILGSLYAPIWTANTIHDTLNQAMIDFPFLGRIFGNERIIVYVGHVDHGKSIEGQEPFSIVTQNGKVESLNAGEIENPTMKIYTNMGTVNRLISGELTPTDALMKGEIRYEGVGFVNKIKFKVLNVVSGLLRKFGLGISRSGNQYLSGTQRD